MRKQRSDSRDRKAQNVYFSKAFSQHMIFDHFSRNFSLTMQIYQTLCNACVSQTQPEYIITALLDAADASLAMKRSSLDAFINACAKTTPPDCK